MTVILKQVSEKEFENSEAAILFDDSDCRRKFAELVETKANFKVSWQSDLIEPQILHIADDIYCLGIDQFFSIFEFNSQKILKSFSLNSFYLHTIIFDGVILVASEENIIKIEKDDFTQSEIIGLPDVFDDFIIRGNGICATCLNGEKVLINCNRKNEEL